MAAQSSPGLPRPPRHLEGSTSRGSSMTPSGLCHAMPPSICTALKFRNFSGLPVGRPVGSKQRRLARAPPMPSEQDRALDSAPQAAGPVQRVTL